MNFDEQMMDRYCQPGKIVRENGVAPEGSLIIKKGEIIAEGIESKTENIRAWTQCRNFPSTPD